MKLSDLKNTYLTDPSIKTEYENLEPEFQIVQSIIDARIERNMTQQELADSTGINRTDLSKLENGNANPSLKTLKRVAAGLGKRIEIRFYDI
ncbi:MAG: helix-turn-helix transcriptional regulator [Clostridiales bacterium]|nr:helix-turn-helix transcriptional regulator [Candidatus Crickella equi]